MHFASVDRLQVPHETEYWPMDFLFTPNVSMLTLICWHKSISESEHYNNTGHQPHMSSHQGEELALWGEMGKSLKIENLCFHCWKGFSRFCSPSFSEYSVLL